MLIPSIKEEKVQVKSTINNALFIIFSFFSTASKNRNYKKSLEQFGLGGEANETIHYTFWLITMTTTKKRMIMIMTIKKITFVCCASLHHTNYHIENLHCVNIPCTVVGFGFLAWPARHHDQLAFCLCVGSAK